VEFRKRKSLSRGRGGGVFSNFHEKEVVEKKGRRNIGKKKQTKVLIPLQKEKGKKISIMV